ncbi:MAG TPA: FMN-binding negative transcriptional regulator [Pirellulaceae bacterium]|nr:FMN-binding negative transcriptional regulator [Pirellulaceae bacterium]
MYVPAHFAENDPAALHDAMERYSFATLISRAGGEPFASHLPLLLERDSGPQGTLIGHMARANPQWREAAGQVVLAVFSGPHAYISPTWYAAEQVVPTWNYVAVHAYGRLELIDDPAAAEAVLRRTIDVYEASQPQPWQLDESPQFALRLVRQIVAFRIPIERTQGKWKLNQNHPEERRERVVAALESQADENSREIARLMRG